MDESDIQSFIPGRLLLLPTHFKFSPSQNCFFHTIRTTYQGYVFFAAPGLNILLKCRKNMQTRDSVKMLKLPFLQSSPLCPVQVVKTLLLLIPGDQDTHLFQIKMPGLSGSL